MFRYTTAVALLALPAALLASPVADASPAPVPVETHANTPVFKRCGGCGGWGGYGGYGGWGGYGGGWGGFPFASSFTNALNANTNAANYNDDTLFVNNNDANAVNSNLNTFNNANTVF
ncbi:hypothetical protein EV175_001879 [Coemansia sp. RSA 1933]|nr:hypothetical protein EV175_001879 [Coemansia sp. RSA 1933]